MRCHEREREHARGSNALLVSRRSLYGGLPRQNIGEHKEWRQRDLGEIKLGLGLTSARDETARVRERQRGGYGIRFIAHVDKQRTWVRVQAVQGAADSN